MPTSTISTSSLGTQPSPRHRRSVRIGTGARVDLAAPHEVLLDHAVVNMNLDGLALETPALEPVGETVDLTIQLEDPDTTIEVVGKVVWTRESPTRQMGVRFENLGSADRAILSRHLYGRERD